MRAICSALIGFFFLRVFFIEGYFFLRRFPERYQMVVFSVRIVPNFINQRKESSFHPTRRAKLLRNFAPVTLIIVMTEDLFRVSESDPAFLVFPQFPVLTSVKVEPQAGITLIPHKKPREHAKIRRVSLSVRHLYFICIYLM